MTILLPPRNGYTLTHAKWDYDTHLAGYTYLFNYICSKKKTSDTTERADAHDHDGCETANHSKSVVVLFAY